MKDRPIVLGLLVSCLIAAAAKAAGSSAPGEAAHRNAIQIGAVELLWGEYSVKFERGLATRGALEVEGSVVDSERGTGYTLGVGYRRHRPGRLSGRFWGPFVTFKDYDDEYTEKVDGTTRVHPYSVRGAAVGVNVGHRWIWRPGLSAVFRFGYGIPLMRIRWEDTRPTDHPDAVRGVLAFMQGFDAELSLGMCF